MKKQIFFMVIFSLLTGASVHSQSLENLSWKVNNALSTYSGYFRFAADTLFFGTQYMNISTPWGTYKESGNSIYFLDFGQRCSVTDTGKYTFIIKNDTLKYTLIKDSCEQRRTNLTTFYWTHIPMGVDNPNFASSFLLFPNPSKGKFSISSEITQIIGAKFEIYNLLGENVFYLTIRSGETEIDLTGLPKGSYCYQIVSEKGSIKTGILIFE